MTLLLERVRRALAPGLRVEAELGAGGMGVVFAARDAALDRPVAVKVLRPEQATAVAAQRFLREARLLARVRHPNVIQVHQAGEADGLFYFVMDRTAGPSLAERLRGGPLGVSETMAVGRDVLAALAAVHAQGVVHRDLKPANVFLEHGRALVADFGIARAASDDGAEPLTHPGGSPGTPDYMAPEQFRGEPATARTDLYSAGMVLYECATGRRWPALSDPAAADWQGVPARLASPLRRALALAPGDRWPDAESFQRALASRPGAPRVAGLALVMAIALLAVSWLARPAAGDAWSPGEAAPETAAGERKWRQAEALYASGRWREADNAFGEALRADSTCLVCRFRRVELDRWLEEDRDTADVRILLESVGRFAPAWQGLVRSLGAPVSDRWALLDSVTTGYSEFPLGWYYLGEERFNRGPLFGIPRREAVEALSQAIHLDESFAAPRLELALALVAEGNRPRAEQAMAAVAALPPAEGLAEAQRLLMRIAFAYRFAREPEAGSPESDPGNAVWADLTRDTTLLALPQAAAGPRVLTGLGAPAGALDLGRRYEAVDGRRALQRSGLYAQMFALVALGRPAAADSAALRFLAMSPGLEHTAFRSQLRAAALVLDPATPPADVAAVRHDLARLLRPATAPTLRREAAWLSALAALRLGETPAARSILASALADEPPPRRRALLVEAALLAAAGDAGAALQLTEPVTGDLERWDRDERSPFLRPAFRMLRAAWHQSNDEPESAPLALRWHQHFHLPNYPVREFPEPAEGDWAMSTLASWQLARQLDRRDEDVCAAYAMVAERWRGGEPRFRARADTAAARLDALGCGR
ncbi:MAG TPA: serine/threonine-protein kinase [Gemmatimonadales bacterium]